MKSLSKAQIKEFFTIEKSELKSRLMPLTLFSFLLTLDQITKIIVDKTIPMFHRDGIAGEISVVGEWIKFIHVRNQGVAWSGMRDLTGFPRVLTLIAVPALFLVAFGIWTLFTRELTKLQRWASAAILAGGLGNIIDRVFRYASGPRDYSKGVVDFIDMSFPKIPFIAPSGRWPTFNVADASIVIGVSILIVSMVVLEIKTARAAKK